MRPDAFIITTTSGEIMSGESESHYLTKKIELSLEKAKVGQDLIIIECKDIDDITTIVEICEA